MVAEILQKIKLMTSFPDSLPVLAVSKKQPVILNVQNVEDFVMLYRFVQLSIETMLLFAYIVIEMITLKTIEKMLRSNNKNMLM